MIFSANAEDDFDAFRMVNAAENAGAQVVSITYNGQVTYPGGLAPHTRFIIWLRADNRDLIDAAMGQALNGK